MDAKIKHLETQLESYERALDLAYINYAKVVDNVTTQEMIKINEIVDRIILLKQMIHDEKGSTHND